MFGDRAWSRQLSLNALRNTDRFGDVANVVEKNHELVAPEARNHIARTNAHLQSFGCFDQELIPEHMAQTVIDDLETVEIEKQYGEHVTRTPAHLADRA